MARIVNVVLVGLLVGAVATWLVLLVAGVVHADTFIDEQTQAALSDQVACNGTSSIVIPGKPTAPVQTHAWTLMNQSATDVFICFGVTCLTTTGSRLQQNMSWSEQTYTGNVSCITAGGTATLGRTIR